MKETKLRGYDRYKQHIDALVAKGYNIKEKNIKTRNMYYESAEAHSRYDEVKSHNMPRDMARRAVTLSPKQMVHLRDKHPGITQSQMKGLGLTEFTILKHFPELTVEELRNLTPEELQARKDAIKAMRKEEGYLAQWGSD